MFYELAVGFRFCINSSDCEEPIEQSQVVNWFYRRLASKLFVDRAREADRNGVLLAAQCDFDLCT